MAFRVLRICAIPGRYHAHYCQPERQFMGYPAILNPTPLPFCCQFPVDPGYSPGDIAHHPDGHLADPDKGFQPFISSSPDRLKHRRVIDQAHFTATARAPVEPPETRREPHVRAVDRRVSGAFPVAAGLSTGREADPAIIDNARLGAAAGLGGAHLEAAVIGHGRFPVTGFLLPFTHHLRTTSQAIMTIPAMNASSIFIAHPRSIRPDGRVIRTGTRMPYGGLSGVARRWPPPWRWRGTRRRPATGLSG